jgi:hypothetical protein
LSEPRVDRSVTFLALAASAGVLAALWIVDYLPAHDGPQHLFLGHLENHFDDPGAGWPAWLERGRAITALGFNLVFSLCERFLAWRTALRLTLSIAALGWGWSYLALTAAIHPRRAMLGLLGFASAISWLLYMGLWSFAMSVALGFAILAAAAGAWPWTLRRRLAIAAILLVQAVVHLFGAELTGLVLLLMVAAAPLPEGSSRGKEVGLLALMGAPALLLAAMTANPEGHRDEWLAFAQRLAATPRMFLPGPLWRALPPVLLALGGLGLAASRLRRKDLAPAEIALAGAAALFLALSFFTPLHLAAWDFFSPRFLPFGCLLGAALLPVERLPDPRRRAALGALALFTAASLAWAAKESVTLRAQVDDALAGLSAPIKRTGPRLVVPMDPYAGLAPAPGDDGAREEIPFYAPLFNLGAIYAVEQGGIPSYTFVTNAKIHPFVLSPEGQKRYPALYDPADLRDPRIATDPLARRALVTFFAAVGAPFEDVVLHGRPEDADVFVARGYEVDFRKGGLFIGRFRGCPVTLEITAPAPRAEAVFVEYGFDPMPQALTRRVLPPEKGEGGVVKIAPDVALCGSAWLRVALDLDRSGGPTKADRFCEGADARGRVRVTAEKGATIRCNVAP